MFFPFPSPSCYPNLRPHYLLPIFTYTHSPSWANFCLAPTNVSSTFFWLSVLFETQICHIILPLNLVLQSNNCSCQKSKQLAVCRISCSVSRFAMLPMLLPNVTWNAPASALCLSNRHLFLFRLKMSTATFGVPSEFLEPCYFSRRDGAGFPSLSLNRTLTASTDRMQ